MEITSDFSKNQAGKSVDFAKKPVLQKNMLVSLQIRNFALIDNALLEFEKGLNILSGETGSGKSIIVQAIELLMGARASVDLIRQGEDEMEVTALFAEDAQETSLRRVVSRSGKSRAYVDERPVPVSALEEAGSRRMDLAGQHSQQVLLTTERHLSLLDDFLNLDCEAYHGHFRSLVAALEKKKKLEEREREIREKQEFLSFQLRELDQAAVRAGEEEELRRERDVAKHAVKLKELCDRVDAFLDSGEGAVSEVLNAAQKDLQAMAQIDASLETHVSEVEEAAVRVRETARELGRYRDRLSGDPERLQEVEDRLALILRLKKKYGGSEESLIAKAQEMRADLDLLENLDTRALESEIRGFEKKVVEAARDLSQKRTQGAQRLSRLIEKELHELGMTHAKFVFQLQPLTQGVSIGGLFYSESGGDAGEFLLAPNPGEGLHPLSKIASGGEVSRVFLAIKKVLGVHRSAETCIFDEVDVGIGGRVADVIGRNLSEMAHDNGAAGEKQILCVTHLPQVACYADRHFVIRKETAKGRTVTRVTLLDTDQRENEIARMLSGVAITDQAKAHAREMLKTARA